MRSQSTANRCIAIVQARMGSSRLPGKVLLDIAGQPMLAWVVERARVAQALDGVWVATTTQPEDDPVAALCAERGYPCTRGSLHDVLDRCYQAALASEAEVIVRLTADCPMIDPSLIDEAICALANRDFETKWDFVANRLPPPWGRTYPIGLDVEVCSFAALERAWKEADQPYQREHVMPYLYEDALPIPPGQCPPLPPHAVALQGRFRVLLLNYAKDYGGLRWTVDTPADLELMRQVFARFPGRGDFSWLEVLDLFHREPALAYINAGVTHKGYRDVDHRTGDQGQGLGEKSVIANRKSAI